MEGELNGRLLKYENETLFLWRDMWRGLPAKNPYWFELKGCINGGGYMVVKIDRKIMSYHRIVYFLHNQEWDIYNTSTDNCIDHIDRNPLNNRIENLRNVTHQENMWNKNCRGYSWNTKEGRWKAQIVFNGKQKHLGIFDDEEDARKCYLAAKAIHHII